MKPPYCKLKGQISCKNLNHFFQSERTQTLEVELPAEVNYTAKLLQNLDQTGRRRKHLNTVSVLNLKWNIKFFLFEDRFLFFVKLQIASMYSNLQYKIKIKLLKTKNTKIAII